MLFVNISVGGTLTSFAAPPVLMVASTWNWDSVFMAANFGLKGQHRRRHQRDLPARPAKIQLTTFVPVREALRRLEAEGWVVLRPRRGYVVASLSRDEIEEVFEIQGMLEERGAFLAAQRRTEQHVSALQAALDHLDQLIARAPLDYEAFGHANAAFHEQLFEASGRSYYCRILRTLRNSAERYARVGASMNDLRLSQAEHHAIVDAFRKGDADGVARSCRVHRENTRDRLLASLEV